MAPYAPAPEIFPQRDSLDAVERSAGLVSRTVCPATVGHGSGMRRISLTVVQCHGAVGGWTRCWAWRWAGRLYPNGSPGHNEQTVSRQVSAQQVFRGLAWWWSERPPYLQSLGHEEQPRSWAVRAAFLRLPA
jgi:hypothetical protein